MPCEAQHWGETHQTYEIVSRFFCQFVYGSDQKMRKTQAEARFCIILWNFLMKNSQSKFSECWFIQILYTTIAIVKAIPCSCKFWASLSFLPYSSCNVRDTTKKFPIFCFVWRIWSLKPTFPLGVRTVYTERWTLNCCVTNTCHK